MPNGAETGLKSARAQARSHAKRTGETNRYDLRLPRLRTAVRRPAIRHKSQAEQDEAAVKAARDDA